MRTDVCVTFLDVQQIHPKGKEEFVENMNIYNTKQEFLTPDG